MGRGKEKMEEVEDNHDAWVKSMTERVQSIGNRPSQTDPCTIYYVPSSICGGDSNAYKPQLVSIGPYHRSQKSLQATKEHNRSQESLQAMEEHNRSQESLQAMEEHKWHHLHSLISRDGNHLLSLGDYIKEIQPLEDRARACYSENINLKSHEFVEMMILDGCFIIELFLKVNGNMAVEVGPIYSTIWMLPLICQDMLLLENQIPFFILQHLFNLVNSSTYSLVNLALNFFDRFLPSDKKFLPSKVVKEIQPSKVRHLLHLVHSHIKPNPNPWLIELEPTTAFDRGPPSLPKSILSVREFQYHLIKMRKKKADSFLDITYEKSTIQIPELTIYASTTNILFRNMIAFEQCCQKAGTYFTSYAIFMHCIFQTTADVMVLKERGIIKHHLGSDEEVVHFFNWMCTGLTIDFQDSYLSGLINHVDKLCRRFGRKNLAYLTRVIDNNLDFILKNIFQSLGIYISLLQTAMTIGKSNQNKS